MVAACSAPSSRDALGGDERVVGDDVACRAPRARDGHQLADAAEAEQRERLVGQLDAAEARALPARRRRSARVGLRDVAGQRQHQRDRVLGGRQRRSTAARCRRGCRARVAASTSTLSTPVPARPITRSRRRGRDQLGVDARGRAHDERVVARRCAAAARPVEPGRRRPRRLAGLGAATRLGDQPRASVGSAKARRRAGSTCSRREQLQLERLRGRATRSPASMAPNVPDAQDAALELALAAGDRRCRGRSRRPRAQRVAVDALRHGDRRHERAVGVVGREQLEAQRRARAARTPRAEPRACAPTSASRPSASIMRSSAASSAEDERDRRRERALRPLRCAFERALPVEVEARVGGRARRAPARARETRRERQARRRHQRLLRARSRRRRDPSASVSSGAAPRDEMASTASRRSARACSSAIACTSAVGAGRGLGVHDARPAQRGRRGRSRAAAASGSGRCPRASAAPRRRRRRPRAIFTQRSPKLPAETTSTRSPGETQVGEGRLERAGARGA